MATNDKSLLPSFSPEDEKEAQKELDRPQNNQVEDTIKHLRGKPGYKVIIEYDKPGDPPKFSQEIPPRKTWWDLLNLIGILLIPLVVAGATLLLSIQQAHLADLQHQQDQLRAQDQQKAVILQTYIDNIQDLLLNHNLLKSSVDIKNPYYDVAILARARTLTALPGLDPERKGRLVQFLYEAHLIGYFDLYTDKPSYPVIYLSHANLGGADLGGANLSYAYLGLADLGGAYLSSAILRGDNLSGAVLRRADLGGAYLRGADLYNAVLTDANLTGADLAGADLEFADLTDANLTDAILRGAYLTAATVTQQQLDQVHSCDGATLPEGLTCHRNQSPP